MTQVKFDYKPLTVHAPFHRSRERERAIIGGYGSGKSYGGCAEAIALGLEQPGSEILITRKTVPALRDTTEAIFVSLLPPAFWDQCKTTRAGGHLNTVQFPNGSLYYFRGMDDWKKLRSLNLAFIFYDEADEFSPEDYEGMNSRLRQTKPQPMATKLGYGNITRRGTILACNPQGRNWIWQRFVSADKAPNTAYWTSSSLDNPYLPFDYLESLLAMPDAWVRRFVLCSFDESSGLIYPGWNDSHVVPSYRDVMGMYAYAPDAFFVMGFDPGTAAKNAAVWCYYDRAQHRLVAVAEYAESGLAADQHAAHWRRTEVQHKMKINWRIADPVIVTRDRGSNVALSDQYRRLGYYFQEGPRKIETRLTALGQLIHNRRLVVTEDCPRLNEQLKQYRWDDLTPLQLERGTAAKPKKTTQWNGEREGVDLVDALQYIATRYIAPPKVDFPAGQNPETAAKWAAMRTQIRGRSATSTHDLGTVPV